MLDRTEVNRVFSIAAQARMNEMGERLPRMKKRWVAVIDSRTRASHIEASGQVVPFDGFFTVGGEKAQFPRDPVLSAGETVNCRCHSVPLLDDEVMEDLGVPPETVPTVEPEPPVPAAGQPDANAWLREGEITDLKKYGTVSTNEMWTGTIGDRLVLIKPEAGLEMSEMRDLITPGLDLAREESALFMAGEFGEDLLTPALVVREVEGLGRSMVAEFIENANRTDADVLELLASFGFGGPQVAGDLRYADMRTMMLFDSVIGNFDRHLGNLLEVQSIGDAGIIRRLWRSTTDSRSPPPGPRPGARRTCSTFSRTTAGARSTRGNSPCSSACWPAKSGSCGSSWTAACGTRRSTPCWPGSSG